MATATQTTSPVEAISSASRNKDTLKYFLRAADFFLLEGNREKYFDDYWSFYTIDGLLRSWAIPFNEKLVSAPYEEIVKFIHELLEEKKTLDALVPNKDLLENLEIEADAARQKELQLRELIKQQSTNLVNKLTKTPVRSEIKVPLSNELANNFLEEVFSTDLPILAEKIKEQPPEERVKLQREIDQKLEQAWQRAIERTSRIVRLTREEKTYLGEISPNIESPQTLTQHEQTNSISKLLSPLSRENAQFLIVPFLNNFVQNLPENLTVDTIEEAALVSTWKMIEQTEVRLSGEEVAKTVKTFVPKTEEQLVEFRRFFSQVRSQSESLESSKTAEVKQARYRGDILKVLSGNETVIQHVKKQLYAFGINTNPKSDRELIALKSQIQVLSLVRAGYSEGDIEVTINNLKEKGFRDNSQEIRELRGLATAFQEFTNNLKVNGFSQKQIHTWQKETLSQAKKGIPFRLPLSPFGVILNKSVISAKFYEFKSSLFSKASSLFLNSTLGRPIKLALEKSAQKSLQGLWSAGKIGIKKTAIPFIQKILVAFGFGAKTALVAATNIVGLALLVVPKLIDKAKDFIKGIFSNGTRVFSSILSGLTGASEVPEDSDSKWLKVGFIVVVVILFFSEFFNATVKSGAMVPLTSIRYTDRIPPSAIKPSCISLSEIFNNAAASECVPAALLMAISRVEASGIWGMDCNQIGQFSSDRWWEQATEEEKTTGYCYDTCAATGLCESDTTVMGPMQFEQATWRGYMPNNDLMDRCRLDLSIQAAAKKLKANSGTDSGTCNNWSETIIRQVAERYCGACRSTACGQDYCGIVWILYQQYANQ